MINRPRLTLSILAAILTSSLTGITFAADPEPDPPVVIFDTDLALPAMPASTGPGIPVCIDESGLLVTGCDGVIGPPGPQGDPGPPGPQGEQGPPGADADLNEVIIPLCELYDLTGQTLPSICGIHECGNGILEYTEECDDGNLDNGDTCSANCLLACEEDATRACSNENTYGICLGEEVCLLSEWQSCTAEVPAADVCDGLDNDCNGSVDDIDPVPCSLTMGACAGSTRLCVDGSLFVCGPDDYGPYYEPEELSCDGVDNDCDGDYDEAFHDGTVTYTGPDGQTGAILGDGCGAGVCAQGTVVCGLDTLSLTCSTAHLASEEVCDGSDNDCDGVIDEGCEDLGASCTTGAECLSGFCVEDVCCDTACDGGSESCLFDNTGLTDGTCGSVF